MRSLAGHILRAWYVILDYVLLILTPITRILPSGMTRCAITSINALYAGWERMNRRMAEVHSGLDTFRSEYDLAQGNFLDPFMQRSDWLDGKKVLDLGCFVGGKTEWFLHNGAREAVGIDLSVRGIEAAKKHQRPGLRYECISSTDLAGREPSSFDTIYSFTVFEHIEASSLPQVVNDCYDLLVPGGRCIVVYNHFYDRFGAHVYHFIRHAWPQILFRQKEYQHYCDDELARRQRAGGYGYFPEGFTYVESVHNKDSYMGLNKLSPGAFRNILQASRFAAWSEIPYSRTPVTRTLHALLPWCRLFEPSYIYVLRKSEQV